jgi:hypothetical protein
MVTPTETSFQLGAASKRIAGRVFVMVENRLQLLMLLVVESELNRVQLLAEVRGFKNELGRLQQEIQAFGSLAASAAKLATIFSTVSGAFFHRHEENAGRRSWISTLLKGLKTGAALWGALRSDQK